MELGTVDEFGIEFCCGMAVEIIGLVVDMKAFDVKRSKHNIPKTR